MKFPRNLYVPLVALAALFLFDFLFIKDFFHLAMNAGRLQGNLIDIFNRAAPVELLAIGMTLVIATGGVDLSVGAVMAIAGTVAAASFAAVDANPAKKSIGQSVPQTMALALVVSAVCGIWNGFLVSFVELQPIVATLLLMVAGRGVAQLISNGSIITFTNKGFGQIATGAILIVPNPVWIALGFAVLIAVLVRRSSLGLFLESVGGNAQASRLSGIDARMVKMAAYTICSIGAGIAGLITCAEITAADANSAGLNLELDAILAVAIGGTSLYGGRFSLIGSMLGAIFMQALTTTVYAKGVSPHATMVLKGAVVIIVCLLQSPKFATMRERMRRQPA